MPHLKRIDGSDGETIPLQEEIVSIGRDSRCSIVLEDATVSRRHAILSLSDGDYYLSDCESRYGTFVNGVQVTQPVRLEELDVIKIRNSEFSFHFGSKPEAGATVASNESTAPDSSVIMSVRTATVAPEWASGVGPEAKLRAVMEILKCLHTSVETKGLLDDVLESLLRIFPQAEHGLILQTDAQTGRLTPRALRDRSAGKVVGEHEIAMAPVSQTIIERAFANGEAILSEDAQTDDLFDASQSISAFSIRSVMCAPLISPKSEKLGVVQVHTQKDGQAFSQEDLDVLIGVASVTAMAFENLRLHENALAQQRIERELELARDVQRGFLPQSVPVVDGYEFFVSYSAAQSVGGDYYDFIELSDGRLVMALGDVSGKGMSAALLMARLSSDIRYAVARTTSPGAALADVNRSLVRAELESRFVTLSLMVLDGRARRLSVANAGHIPPLLVGADGQIAPLAPEVAGFPLNVSDDPKYAYRTADVSLEPGFSVVAYTDGLSEALSPAGVEFGAERIRSCIEESPKSAKTLGASIVAAQRSFVDTAKQHDDTTLLCFGETRSSRD